MGSVHDGRESLATTSVCSDGGVMEEVVRIMVDQKTDKVLRPGPKVGSNFQKPTPRDPLQQTS